MAEETERPGTTVPSQPTIPIAKIGPPTGAGGGSTTGGGGESGAPAPGMPLPAFIAAVGRSVATAAQDLRAMPVPRGAPGVELRGASLTIKGVVNWDPAGTLRLQPAQPGDAETAVSQLLLNYESVPRLPTSDPTGTR